MIGKTVLLRPSSLEVLILDRIIVYRLGISVTAYLVQFNDCGIGTIYPDDIKNIIKD